MIKKNNIRFSIRLFIAILILTTTVILVVLDGRDKTFSLLSMVFMLAGVALTIVNYFKKSEVLSLLNNFLYAAGFGAFLFSSAPSISDVFNGVVYIGGNGKLAIVFNVIYAIIIFISAFV